MSALKIPQAQVTREARARYFGDMLPASTLVQVVALAHPDLMIEIEVIAALADESASRRANL